MKHVILFCLLGGYASALTVTVPSTSPTQAMLVYTSPTSAACTVEVSESNTYSPLVHDVDGTLFSGSASDSRSGALRSGTSRIFLVGTRSIEAASDSRKYSRALQQATLHYYRVTCAGPIVATGTFTTKTLPFGTTYSDLFPTNADGTYNLPSYSTTDRTETIVDSQTGVLMQHVNIDSDFTDSGLFLYPSAGGFGQFCADTLSVQGNWHCLLPSFAGGPGFLYAINPATGGATFLGAALTNTFFLDRSTLQNIPITGVETTNFDAHDPNVIYQRVVIPSTPPRVTIAKWIYTGNDDPATILPGSPSLAPAATIDMLGGADLRALLTAFDSSYDASVFTPDVVAVQANHALLVSRAGYQNSISWIGAYNLGNGLPLGSGGTGNVTAALPMWKAPGTRWCGDHSTEFLGSNTPIMSESTDYMANGNEYAGPYNMILETALNNTDAPLTHRTVKVSSASLINTHTGTCTDTWSAPVGWVDGEPLSPCVYHYLMNIQAGDVLNIAGEFVEVAAVDSPTSIEIIRAVAGSFIGAHNISDSILVWCQNGKSNNPFISSGGYVFWDFVNSPHGTEHAGDYVLNWGSHPAYRVDHRVDAGYPFNVGAATDKSLWGLTIPYNTTSHPKFGNAFAPGDGNAYQKHVSMASGDGNSFFDGTYFVGTTIFGSTPATHVAPFSHVYRYFPAADPPLAPKSLPILTKTCVATSGCQSQALKDISGPGSVMDDTSDYTWCLAAAANECVFGSSPGNVYFSMSTLDPSWNFCSGGENSLPVQDICIGNFAAMGLAAMQYKFVPGDTTGGQSYRPLARTFASYNRMYATIKLTYDGKFGLIWYMEKYPVHTTVWSLKIPPDPGNDGIARDTFVPAVLNLTPPAGLGIAKAQVKFWYAEQGGTFTNPYCTSRREACVATRATISDLSNPFWYASTDTYSPASCSTSCTITLPIYPLHTAYYSVEYMNASGDLVTTAQGIAMENKPASLGSAPQTSLTTILRGAAVTGGNLR